VSVPLWVAETAEAFWADAGGHEPFPRELRGAIANALPLTLVLLPRLRVAGVDVWLRRNGAPGAGLAGDRRLRACLLARNGH
jgi:hypothetical protein